MGKQTIMTEEKVKEAIQMRKDGYKITEIAEIFGVKYNTVLSALHRDDEYCRSHGRAKPLVCPKCGYEQMDKDAKFCSHCGGRFMSEKEQIISLLEKDVLCGICDFPCNHRDEMRDAILRVVAYIKKEVQDER